MNHSSVTATATDVPSSSRAKSAELELETNDFTAHHHNGSQLNRVSRRHIHQLKIAAREGAGIVGKKSMVSLD